MTSETPTTPEQFAINLVRETVTTDRVASVMARIAGDRIKVGPLRVGPGRAVVATGVGLIGRIAVTERTAGGQAHTQGGLFGFDAIIPGELTIDLTAGSVGRPRHYEGTVAVKMAIDIRLQAPAWVVLDVIPVQPSDVSVRLRTSGMATFVLQTLGDANQEVAGQVSAVVNRRVAAVADLRRIDLAALLGRAWEAEMALTPGLERSEGS